MPYTHYTGPQLIKEVLHQRQWTQSELAEHLNIWQETVSRLLNRHLDMQIDTELALKFLLIEPNLSTKQKAMIKKEL